MTTHSFTTLEMCLLKARAFSLLFVLLSVKSNPFQCIAMLADWFPNQVDWRLVEVRRRREGGEFGDHHDSHVDQLYIYFDHLYIYFDHHHHDLYDAMGGRSA